MSTEKRRNWPNNVLCRHSRIFLVLPDWFLRWMFDLCRWELFHWCWTNDCRWWIVVVYSRVERVSIPIGKNKIVQWDWVYSRVMILHRSMSTNDDSWNWQKHCFLEMSIHRVRRKRRSTKNSVWPECRNNDIWNCLVFPIDAFEDPKTPNESICRRKQDWPLPISVRNNVANRTNTTSNDEGNILRPVRSYPPTIEPKNNRWVNTLGRPKRTDRCGWGAGRVGQRLRTTFQRRNEISSRTRKNVRETIRWSTLERKHWSTTSKEKISHRGLRLEERITPRVKCSIARIELKLAKGNDEECLVALRGKTYTGPEIWFELTLLLLFNDPFGLGGWALAMITRPVLGFPLLSPDDWLVVATKYCPCWPFRRDSFWRTTNDLSSGWCLERGIFLLVLEVMLSMLTLFRLKR